MNREAAWTILNEYTKSKALIQHGLCVEAAMRHYASSIGENVEQWGLTGLLHDFDYERWDHAPEHTREGAKILAKADFEEEVIGAILSHVPWNLEEYPRDRPIRKTLFAVDELCGFLYAAALVRPQRLNDLKPKSIIKKLKQKSFAASVSREDIHEGVQLLELDLSEHIANCITALQSIASDIDLVPSEVSSSEDLNRCDQL